MFKAQNFSMEFPWGLFFAFLVDFVGSPRVCLGWIFASIQSACSLEILSTQNPVPTAPPHWNCPQRSLKISTDIPVAVFLDHSIEITKR